MPCFTLVFLPITEAKTYLACPMLFAWERATQDNTLINLPCVLDEFQVLVTLERDPLTD